MIKKIYSVIQKIILGYVVYFLLLPAITPFMKKIIPDFWQCSYTKVTGKPCPFEGITGDFKNIILYGMEENTVNVISKPLFIYFICEITVRIIICIYLKKISVKRIKIIIIIDVIIHILFLVYIIFLISTFWTF